MHSDDDTNGHEGWMPLVCAAISRFREKRPVEAYDRKFTRLSDRLRMVAFRALDQAPDAEVIDIIAWCDYPPHNGRTFLTRAERGPATLDMAHRSRVLIATFQH